MNLDFKIGAVGAAIGAAVITPISTGISYIAKAAGIIPEVTWEDNIRQTIANLQNNGMNQFNVTALLEAPCYLEEFSRQYNLHDISHTSPLRIKVEQIVIIGLSAPIFEEILFRKIIQGQLLEPFTNYILEMGRPGRERLFAKIDKIARITFTSAIFSAFHLLNVGTFSDAYVCAQLIQTFVLGIGFGFIMEERGLGTAIGAHVANNIIALWPSLMSC